MKHTTKSLHLAACLLFVACAQSLHCDRHGHCAGSLSSVFCNNPSCVSLPHLSRGQIDGANQTSLQQITGQINRQKLSVQDRRAIIDIMMNFFENFNPNIFIYRNVVGIDPVRRLRSFKNSPALTKLSNFDFHLRMMRIFRSLDDYHSQYFPPPPMMQVFAVLGFSVQFYYPSKTSQPVFLVSDIVPGFTFPNSLFTVGATIVEFDGKPIPQAAKHLGEAEYASNDASILKDGTTALTTRFFNRHKIPFRKSAKIKFIPKNSSKISTVSIPWKIYKGVEGDLLLEYFLENIVLTASAPVPPQPKPSAFSNRTTPDTTDPSISFKPITIKKDYEGIIAAGIIKTSHGSFGYFRLFSFARDGDGGLVSEIARVLKLLPASGLIIDMRQNRGGDPTLAKHITQLISSKPVPRSPLTLRATPLTARMLNIRNASAAAQLTIDTFGPALRGALRAGEPFSGPTSDVFEFFAVDPTRSFEQVYFGPVITLVDATCYSSCDIFVSVQKDIGTSFVVNLDSTTGGGGASTISYGALSTGFPTVFNTTLPEGIEFLISSIRFYRLGNESGALIEKVGVEPDVQYYRTKNDVLNDDIDLFNYLTSELIQKSS